MLDKEGHRHTLRILIRFAIQGNNGYANASHFNVRRTLSVLLNVKGGT